MALNPARISRAISPATSEGSVRRGHVSRLRDQEEGLKKDKSYRRYAAGVERALSLFDTTLQEWADYISFLSRLVKALQSHPEGARAIPHKAFVAKRLAQCMNPNLPSGVHQKALEAYGFIFALLDEEALGEDLTVYFPGLAPTLSFASLSVRPLFLSLLQEHISNLSVEHLRPALKAIILALLPGLEEETSEDFERSLLLLNGFRKRFESANSAEGPQADQAGAAYFWQCLFLTSITSPSRRVGVLAYLTRYLPKLGTAPKMTQNGEADVDSAVIAVSSPAPGLLLRCFATGLADDQLLVQRAFLDLLVTHIPLHAKELKGKAVHDDLVLLVTSALGVVLRREMSLNRRLWSWFLGPEPVSPVRSPDRTDFPTNLHMTTDRPGQGYFERHGREITIESLLTMISSSSSSPPSRARPFRIALSLMDRWEVGGSVVPRLFVPLLRNVKDFEAAATSKEDFEEVFRSANVFFDGVESAVIWAEVFQLLDPHRSLDVDGIKGEDAELVHFIISRFNIREEEMLAVHIPLNILTLITLLRTNEDDLMTTSIEEIHPQRLDHCTQMLEILQILLEVVPESVFVASNKDARQSEDSAKKPTAHTVVDRIRRFYVQSRESFDLPPVPFDPETLCDLALDGACELASQTIRSGRAGRYLQQRVQIVCMLVQKCPPNEMVVNADLGSIIQKRLSTARSQKLKGAEEHPNVQFSLISSLASLTIFLHTTSKDSSYLRIGQLKSIIPSIMKHLWSYLSPLTPHVHVEATTCIWQLHTATMPHTIVASALTTLMSISNDQGNGFLPEREAIRRFSVIWTQSMTRSGSAPKAGGWIKEPEAALLTRPMDLVIDVLAQSGSNGYEAAEEWLQAQTSTERILGPVILQLQEGVERMMSGVESVSICQWQLGRLSHLISAQSEEQWVKFGQNVAIGKTDADSKETMQMLVAKTCLRILPARSSDPDDGDKRDLQLLAIDVLSQLLHAPTSILLAPLNIDMFLITRLSDSLDDEDSEIQSKMIDCLTHAIRVRVAETRAPQQPQQQAQHNRRTSKDVSESMRRLSISDRRGSKDRPQNVPLGPPKELLDCLLKGVLVAKDPSVLHKWIGLLCDSLPLWSDAIFQVILEIVEHFIRRIQSEFLQLQAAFTNDDPAKAFCSDAPLLHLLNGLEFCIASAHDRLTQDEQYVSTAKSPELAQGFFQNMVSNAAGVETNQLRNAIANNRLTIVLCFQDITKTIFDIWSWDRPLSADQEQFDDTAASFKYTVLKFRNRCRKILEHLVAAEPLETLEILIELWTDTGKEDRELRAESVLNLFHTLEGTRPRNAMPAIFNASYSRSNPSALDPTRKSTLTSNLSDSDLLAFLIVYARSLEDDVLEEIWIDCTTFLRDILGNPMPHRMILPRLLEFIAVLSSKMEHTNFGEEWKMRRELGDLFTRLLTAIFTIRPPGLSPETPGDSGPDDIVHILDQTFPALISLLGESDRLTSIISGMSTNIVSAAFKTRSFPQNFYPSILSLLYQISKLPSATKIWRRDVLDLFNDPRIFHSTPVMLARGWQPLIRQLVLADKERMTELLSRLTAPTTAGIMFGVGASAARLEADKKTQLNLRRIALMLLCVENDTFVGTYPQLLAKIEELLTATPVTSPSSTTRAEIYLVLRALVLKSSTLHLAPFWPIISSELYEIFTTLISDLHPDTSEPSGKYSPFSTLQAAKLLDILLFVRPDDFQLQEWLFVTDTMDAIYPPPPLAAAPSTTPSPSQPQQPPPLPLADDVGLALQSLPALSPLPSSPSSSQPQPNPSSTSSSFFPSPSTSSQQPTTSMPFLAVPQTRSAQLLGSGSGPASGSGSVQTVLNVLLRPFFSNLSIHAMESTYALHVPDLDVAVADLREDLVFNVPTD